MPPDPAPTARSAHDLHGLFAAGDRACLTGEADELSAAAHLLGLCVDEVDHVELDAVARLAATDARAAAARWRAITDALRGRLFDEAPSAHRA